MYLLISVSFFSMLFLICIGEMSILLNVRTNYPAFCTLFRFRQIGLLRLFNCRESPIARTLTLEGGPVRWILRWAGICESENDRLRNTREKNRVRHTLYVNQPSIPTGCRGKENINAQSLRAFYPFQRSNFLIQTHTHAF